MAIEALEIEIKHRAEGANDVVEHLIGSLGKLHTVLTGVASAIKVPIKASEAVGSIERATAAVEQRGNAAVSAAKKESAALDFVQMKYAQIISRLDFYKGRIDRMQNWAYENGGTDVTRDTIAQDYERVFELEKQRAEAERELKAAIDERHAAEVADATEGLAAAQREAAEAAEELAAAQQRAEEARGPGLTVYNWQQMQADAAAAAQEVSAAALAEQIAAQAATELSTTLKLAAAGFGLVAKGAIAVARGVGGVAVKGFKALGNALSAPIKKVGQLFRTIGRMALYRAIRAAIRLVAQGVKEGTENFAKWDYATGQLSGANAVKTLNEYGNAFAYLKNSVGAAAMPIMQALLPAIKSIINMAVQAANAISALVSAIMGLGHYFGAAADTGYALEDSFNSAGGGASKLKNTILGFDELNVMNDQNSGGGGGGGGTMSGITDNLFEKLNLPEWATYLSGKIKEAWENADFSFFGAILADKFNHLMDVDWKGIKDGVRKLVKSITSFLNSFIKNIDWGQIARNMSNGILLTLESVTQFLTEIDWSEVGKAIVDFFENIDYAAIANAIGALFRAVIAAIVQVMTPIVESAFNNIKIAWNEFKQWILRESPWLANLLGIEAGM